MPEAEAALKEKYVRWADTRRMAMHLRSLPRFNQMQAQWAAQGLEGSVTVAMEEAASAQRRGSMAVVSSAAT